jgi:hypothetical protein
MGVGTPAVVPFPGLIVGEASRAIDEKYESTCALYAPSQNTETKTSRNQKHRFIMLSHTLKEKRIRTKTPKGFIPLP